MRPSYIQQIYSANQHTYYGNIYFRKLMREALRDFPSAMSFTDKELSQSTSLIMDIRCDRELTSDQETKHFHVFALLHAAWVKNEKNVAFILQKTPYDQDLMKNYAALVFAYRGTWRTLAASRKFYGRQLDHYELNGIAFAAGAGGNIDLIQDMQRHFPWILKKAHQGAESYGTRKTVSLCKEMGSTLGDTSPLLQYWRALVTVLLLYLVFRV